jgi:calcineurin-like phosphoesterase family protein
MNFYISDQQFGQKSIIKMCHRPFIDVDDMNKTMILNHNNAVSTVDDVWILGDLCYKINSSEVYNIISKLNGRKHLIIGNHDGKLLQDEECRKLFEDIQQIAKINDNGKEILMFHYPIVEWDGYYRDTIHLYGHIHNNVNNNAYKVMKNIPNAYNVSADILNYRPRKLEDVIKMNEKFFAEN